MNYVVFDGSHSAVKWVSIIYFVTPSNDVSYSSWVRPDLEQRWQVNTEVSSL